MDNCKQNYERVSMALVHAVRRPSDIKTDGAWKRLQRGLARQYGVNRGGLKMGVRRAVTAAAIAEAGGVHEYTMALARLFPRVPIEGGDVHLVDSQHLAFLRGLKRTDSLAATKQAANRGQFDTDSRFPRFYWRPSRSGDGRDYYDSIFGRVGIRDRVDRRGVCIFSERPVQELAAACEMELRFVGLGVADTRDGMMQAANAPMLDAKAEAWAAGHQERFAMYCEATGQTARASTALAFCKAASCPAEIVDLAAERLARAA